MPLDNSDPQLEDAEDVDQGAGSAGAGAEPPWARALGESVGSLANMIKEAMANAPRQQETATEEEEETPDPTDEELEVMDRATFGRHLVGQVLKAVNKNVVGPLNSQLAEITAATTRTEIQGSVKELAATNKDFWDWKDEMISLANEHRGLAPKRLLQLARADNPDKAAKLVKKYDPSAGNEAVRRRVGFGGMTPSQSGTGSRTRLMKPKEAANVAWAETVAALGGEPMFGDEDDG